MREESITAVSDIMDALDSAEKWTVSWCILRLDTPSLCLPGHCCKVHLHKYSRAILLERFRFLQLYIFTPLDF